MLLDVVDAAVVVVSTFKVGEETVRVFVGGKTAVLFGG